MLSDIEIARQAKLKPISQVAKSLGIPEDDLIPYGRYMAKTDKKGKKKGKLILVTAINPTAAGEGKTTVSIGLADAMKKIGKDVCLALREPSLGPVFGVKGGAAGGGYAQIAPMENINLHFTGDLHAITSANNLLASIIDNHIYFGNELRIKKVTWRRCVDLNDRALRNTVSGLNWGSTREDGFDITAASEVMAVFCLSKDLTDLKKRLGDIIVGEDYDGKEVTARDLKADEAMTILLADALKPNLVQTLEGTPSFVHGGPFANIAHGCNSVIATSTALSYADYVVTEAGFGADLGAEKFLDIKCRTAGFKPEAAVIVATVRGLKCAGGVKKEDLNKRNYEALEKGLPNLIKHIENMTGVYGLNVVVAINKFLTDEDGEIQIVRQACEKVGASVALCECFAKGGDGGKELAEKVVAAAQNGSKKPTFCYDDKDTPKEKIEKVAKRIYGADGVIFTPAAQKKLAALSGAAEKMPVCIAKTQYSLSDNAALLGRPTGFKITVRDLIKRGGAGFLVALAGDIFLMPGLPKQPNAEKMTIDENGVISGLF